jgi:hypothetical protein
MKLSRLALLLAFLAAFIIPWLGATAHGAAPAAEELLASAQEEGAPPEQGGYTDELLTTDPEDEDAAEERDIEPLDRYEQPQDEHTNGDVQAPEPEGHEPAGHEQ